MTYHMSGYPGRVRLFLGGRAGAGGGLHRPGHRQEERHPGGGQEEDEEGPLLTTTQKYLHISPHRHVISTQIYTLYQVKINSYSRMSSHILNVKLLLSR